MKSLPLPRSLFVSAGLLVLAACASLGTPADQAHVEDLWERMRGYRNWPQLEGWEGMVPSLSVHGNFVRIYANDVAAGDPQGLPDGSILVKEGFSEDDPSTLRAVTVMERRAGYAPEAGDWFWARYERDGTPTDAGQVGFCADCHASAGGDDYSFVNDDL